MDNIDKLIDNILMFQKHDYLIVKDEKISNKIYYKYDKILELLLEIKKIKEENYKNSEE